MNRFVLPGKFSVGCVVVTSRFGFEVGVSVKTLSHGFNRPKNMKDKKGNVQVADGIRGISGGLWK